MNIVQHPSVDYNVYNSMISTPKRGILETADPNYYTQTRSLDLHAHVWKKLVDFKQDNLKILEIGSGYGRLQPQLLKLNPGTKYLGITREHLVRKNKPVSYQDNIRVVNQRYNDVSPEELEALTLHDLLYFEINQTLPFLQSESFNVIMSLYTYNCIVRIDSLIEEMYRLLEPNGWLLLPHFDVPVLKDGTPIHFQTHLKEIGYNVFHAGGLHYMLQKTIPYSNILTPKMVNGTLESFIA